jgi:hypothetical protein
MESAGIVPGGGAKGGGRGSGGQGAASPFCAGHGTLQLGYSASVGHQPPNSESFNRH